MVDTAAAAAALPDLLLCAAAQYYPGAAYSPSRETSNDGDPST